MTAKTKKWLITCFSLILVALVLCLSPLTASAYGQYPYNVTLTNPSNIPIDGSVTLDYYLGNENVEVDAFGTHSITRPVDEGAITVVNDGIVDGIPMITIIDNGTSIQCIGDIPAGSYYIDYYITVTDPSIEIVLPEGNITTGIYEFDFGELGTTGAIYFVADTDTFTVQSVDVNIGDIQMYHALRPADDIPPSECPTLEEQIAGYTGTWDELANIIQANNTQLYSQLVTNWYSWYENGYANGLNAGYNNGFDAGFSEGHTEGYAEGYNQALNGNAIRDPIDQYWNSTKDYILIAGQPYFAPNGFGSIDEYNTVGIYGEHESKLNKRDGTTQAFNGQYVTQFASAGTLGGGWYKLGATVGDENAYEQSFNVSAMDKAYYVARVSPLGDPVEEFLVAIWLDGYEAWYVAEEYVYYGTVANNNKSYKQVYSIYMTDIRPTAQRFINYDTPVLHETFNEDINATLYLATFNQLNNYNVYTDGIGIVESYNNGFDAGANTTLWLDLLSQPIVAFFSIPLAQVIVEGVTYTLTYGIVLGAGIVALIVVWFIKLFAGG